MRTGFFPGVLLAVSALCGQAMAQVPPAEAARPAPQARPQRLICEKEVPIGSRLGGRQVCVTPEGMAARRLQERQAVERAQASPCLPTHQAGGVAAC